MATGSSRKLDGKSILITGGTGSFGKRFVKAVLERYNPRRLIIYSRDELKQYEMQQTFNPEKHDCLRYFLGDVRDLDRLNMALRGVDVVVHAAALKQVPAAEYNPTECIKTNVLGAENLVMASISAKVEKVIALSTDKAASPINLYGASKLAADKIFVAGNRLSGIDGTVFSCVRYGNVVGSRGSVIPFFQKLIDEGADKLPITDPRMTRFWITLQQGVDFVLSSFDIMKGGEIFVPKIPSMKITDLAAAMAPNLTLETVGIRPGEKLHEIMVTEDDARYTVQLKDRYIIEPYFTHALGLKIFEESTPVPEDFRYSSDKNPEWLTTDQLKAMIAEP